MTEQQERRMLNSNGDTWLKKLSTKDDKAKEHATEKNRLRNQLAKLMERRSENVSQIIEA